ncbi:hypothetical protein J3R30DRAFT_1827504 [Lentinula aciculospora]|uniref:C2H2-type domain-containing protein n=1 Tax=Lentinula aciculospora TaxID=153920 RepID=A0A9W9DSX1_9AGAR|nr:hypothetical protein J3R30DRAFT_1827504 [Lentinula aciculospora]
MAMWSPSDSPTFAFENPLESLHNFESEYNFEQLMKSSKGSLFDGSEDLADLFEHGSIEVPNPLASTSPVPSTSTMAPISSDSLERYLLRSTSSSFASTATCSPADTLLNVSGPSTLQNVGEHHYDVEAIDEGLSSSIQAGTDAYEGPYTWPVVHPASPLVLASPVAAQKRKRVNEDEASYRDVASHHRATKRRISYKEADLSDLDDGDDDDEPEYEDDGDSNADGPEPLNIKGPSSKTYQCGYPDCPKVFGRSYDAQRHIDTAHKAKKYTCPSCKKSLSRRDALVRHIKMSKRCAKLQSGDNAKDER